MEELRLAVVEKADELCQEYIRREKENEKYSAYKADDMAYIRFAKEEKNCLNSYICVTDSANPFRKQQNTRRKRSQ